MTKNRRTDVVTAKATVLQCVQKSCGGRVRIYSLSCGDHESERFRFSVQEADEVATIYVACPFLRAAVLFDKIVRGEIPPYVLEEIVADFLGENE